jgi:glycosyltransferase involved in cell wall biosynthesis
MNLEPEDITVAITVFNRRQFLKQAISSALEQTVPVRVIVVEDCGPDAGMEAFVKQEFGTRIQYIRNPQRRGLFGNWNACIENCRTPWLSILHDDDYLTSKFAEAMIALHRQAPDCGLYFGETTMVDGTGKILSYDVHPPLSTPWRRIPLEDTLAITPFPFPGQLFKVEHARALGGFRDSSQYCGDWEMWCNLIAHSGGAKTRVTVAINRSHGGLERGTSKIFLNGRLRPLSFVQQKRILHLLRQSGKRAPFDRASFLRASPMSASYLIRHGAGITPRLLRYNVGLLLRSPSPSASHAVFKAASRFLGVRFVNMASLLVRLISRQRVQSGK